MGPGCCLIPHNVETWIVDQRPRFDLAIANEISTNERRLEIVEINARERLGDVQRARPAIETQAIPIEYAISGIRVLLDFENDQARANRVNTAARQKHGIPGLDGNSMKAFGHRPGLDFSLELGACHAAPQSDVQLRAWRGVGNVPHLRLGLASEFSGFGGRRVDLQGEFFLGIENFDEQRETPLLGLGRAESVSGAIFCTTRSTSQCRSLPANGPLAMMLTSPGRSLISQDSPIGTRGGRGLW